MGFPIPIVSELVGLGREWIAGKQKIKAAKTEAEAAVLVNSAKSVDEWERVQAQNSRDSWKDEYLIVLLTAPIPLCMFPDLAAHIQEGFRVLGTLPEWYQWALIAGIGASFGIKVTNRFKK